MTDDSKQLASGLADTLMRAAEEQVTKAQTMMDQTKALVEIMQTQMTAHAKATEDMNARFREVGSIMLDAHRILNGNEAAGLERMVVHGADADRYLALAGRQEVPDAARRGSFAGAGLRTLKPEHPGIGTLDPAITRDPKRDPDANYSAGHGKLPYTVGRVAQFDPRDSHGEDRRDPGTGSKQPDRD